MLLVRSLLFSAGQMISILLFAPLSLLTFPFPFRQRYGFIVLWARFILWWLERTCRLRYEVLGREHIPESNAIIMCKHQSAWETIALQAIFPPQVWVLKRELLWIPLFGWALAMLEPIAIDRGAGRRAIQQIVEQGTQRLQQGRWVVIFPEGTRVAPGTRKRYGIGGAILAEQSGFSIVPVAHNAGEYWPRRAYIKRPGTIRIVIGPPVKTAGRTAADIIAQVESWIEGTMEEINR